MSFKKTQEVQWTIKEGLRELTHVLAHMNYEVSGNQIIVRDHGKRLVIDLVYEGERHLGSLDLPMTQVNYEFIGYTQEEMGEFMEHLKLHEMRMGG
ncbi:MAG: hypothetical protein R3F02_21455 [Thiolinea sp.]